MAFYGSVGWWAELPKAHEITDVSKYFEESDNIPCSRKISKVVSEDVSEDVSEASSESSTSVKFSF